jgi:hypothetical protein
MAYDVTKDDVVDKVEAADELVRDAFGIVSTVFWQAERLESHKASKEWNSYRSQLNSISKAIFDLKQDLKT